MLGIGTGPFKTIRKIEHNYDLEFILVQLTTLSNLEILLCSCYRPPNAEKIWMENFENFLNDICSRVIQKLSSPATSTYRARVGSRVATRQAQMKDRLSEYWTITF